MAQITTDQVRSFRDDIGRMDRRRQGRSARFRERLTDREDQHISYATANKYWGAIRQLFAWARSEGKAPFDPTDGLKLDRRKGDERRSPTPFSTIELRRFFSTPLYQGHQSRHRLNAPGDCQERGQAWWAGLLQLFTGMRAGELSQLEHADFVLDAEIPYLRIRPEDSSGARTKSIKNLSSKRDVPIAPTLLELGFRQFIERRRKIAPKKRVFEQFRVGGAGKVSEGMSRFWGDYLRRYGLHKPGRATHVMRHTLVQLLREADVAQEDIAAVVGHSQRTQTSQYGRSDYPLNRKLASLKRLSLGFDIVEHLGGAYVAQRHRC